MFARLSQNRLHHNTGEFHQLFFLRAKLHYNVGKKSLPFSVPRTMMQFFVRF